MSKKVKIFISQPMRNKTTYEILEEREKSYQKSEKRIW